MPRLSLDHYPIKRAQQIGEVRGLMRFLMIWTTLIGAQAADLQTGFENVAFCQNR
jgi:hypothetical protein